MSHPPLYAFAQSFAPHLRTLSALLDKAGAHARAQGLDPDALAEARLAPDMLPLKAQVRFACDLAGQAMARLVGDEAPVTADTLDPATLEQLRARIAAAVAYLEAVPPGRFEGAERSAIAFPVGEIAVEFTGLQFLRDWSFPNFYFHLVTAYALLRGQGAPLGKADYMAHVGYAIRAG